MSTIIVDAATRDQLLAAAEGVVEFRDASGALVAEYVKVTRVGAHVVEGDWPTDEELDREQPRRLYSADEVAARLRKLREVLE